MIRATALTLVPHAALNEAGAPADDVEALGLCALVWAASDVARRVVDVLQPSEFLRPWYGSLLWNLVCQDRSPANVETDVPNRWMLSGRRH